MRLCVLIAAIASVLAMAGMASGQGPSLTVWFAEAQADVSDKLALLCADQQATVSEQDDRHVLCTRPMTGLAAAYAFGGRGATSPQLMVRFTLLKDKGSTRVQASQWVENQSAMGQIRRSELNSQKQTASLEDKLIAVGGHNYPPDLNDASAPGKPTTTPAP